MPERKADETVPAWTFLSNHGHVLLLIAQDPEVTLRKVADLVGITERAVQRIVADLEAARYLERQRAGRQNRYTVHSDLPLRHPVEAHRNIGALIALVMPAVNGDHAAPPRQSGSPGEGHPVRPLTRANVTNRGSKGRDSPGSDSTETPKSQGGRSTSPA